jgi:hypothetical protein
MTADAVAKRMTQVVCVAAAVIIAGGVLYHRSIEALWFALGVCMTSGANIARIHMLKNAVEKATTYDEKKSAVNYIRGQYLIRFILLGAVLFAAAMAATNTGHLSLLWGAVAGAFTLQVSLYALKPYHKKMEASKKTDHTTQ